MNWKYMWVVELYHRKVGGCIVFYANEYYPGWESIRSETKSTEKVDSLVCHRREIVYIKSPYSVEKLIVADGIVCTRWYGAMDT
jgi:hypothetical protein